MPNGPVSALLLTLARILFHVEHVCFRANGTCFCRLAEYFVVDIGGANGPPQPLKHVNILSFPLSLSVPLCLYVMLLLAGPVPHLFTVARVPTVQSLTRSPLSTARTQRQLQPAPLGLRL